MDPVRCAELILREAYCLLDEMMPGSDLQHIAEVFVIAAERRLEAEKKLVDPTPE